MGFLDDVIKAIQDSAEEARQKDQARRNADTAAPPPLYPGSLPRERQAARVNRRMRDNDPPQVIPQAPPAPPRAPAPPPPAPKHDGLPSAERFRRLLGQPRTIRELMVLSEILGPPRAHRPMRRLGHGQRPPAPPAQP